eukprot:4926956-Prymnesium_polylepis.1
MGSVKRSYDRFRIACRVGRADGSGAGEVEGASAVQEAGVDAFALAWCCAPASASAAMSGTWHVPRCAVA